MISGTGSPFFFLLFFADPESLDEVVEQVAMCLWIVFSIRSIRDPNEPSRLVIVCNDSLILTVPSFDPVGEVHSRGSEVSNTGGSEKESPAESLSSPLREFPGRLVCSWFTGLRGSSRSSSDNISSISCLLVSFVLVVLFGVYSTNPRAAAPLDDLGVDHVGATGVVSSPDLRLGVFFWEGVVTFDCSFGHLSPLTIVGKNALQGLPH